MLAWVKEAEGLVFKDVAVPTPRPDELLVRVEAVSLNRGELRTVALGGDGVIPGWDIAGTVEREAAQGSGPAAGQRVTAMVERGAWAQYVAVPLHQAAAIPEGVTTSAAATLPLAGLTILAAFARAGSIIGKRVLITGASGGLGTLAIQIARLGGAIVTGVSSVGPDVQGEFDFILESAGGDSLAQAVTRLGPEGLVVSIGNSSARETTFNARTLYANRGATIQGLMVFEEVEQRRVGSRELGFLLELVRTGLLVPAVQVERNWRDLPAVLADLDQRRFKGKAVMTVD